MGCQTVRAAAELYVGCVEVGVGLIPAGGGCMEMAARASARACDDPQFDVAGAGARPLSRRWRMARVVDQRRGGPRPGLPAPGDSVSMARETLIADAKDLALGLARAGYRPPPPRMHPRHRRDGGGHPALGAAQPGGGAPDQRPRRQDRRPPGPDPVGRRGAGRRGRVRTAILDLEREAFLSLCGEPKTRDRIQHMLSNGQTPAELRGTCPPCAMSPSWLRSAPRSAAPRRGLFTNTRPDDLGALVAQGGHLARAEIRRPMWKTWSSAARSPESEQGPERGARWWASWPGLPDEMPAMTINRFCSSGLQADVHRGGPDRRRRDRRRAGRRARVDVADPDGRRQGRR